METKLKKAEKLLLEIQHYFEDKDKMFARAVGNAKDAIRCKLGDIENMRNQISKIESNEK